MSRAHPLQFSRPEQGRRGIVAGRCNDVSAAAPWPLLLNAPELTILTPLSVDAFPQVTIEGRELMAKTCPISKEDFFAKAAPLKIEINGIPMVAEPKAFSTGSFGWYLNGKVTMTVEGKAVPVQIGANFTVVGSKEASLG